MGGDKYQKAILHTLNGVKNLAEEWMNEWLGWLSLVYNIIEKPYKKLTWLITAGFKILLNKYCA